MTDAEQVEAVAKAIFRARHGAHADPDWPVGVDRLGYHQEPYVDSVPRWKWDGCERDAIAALTAASAHTGERMARALEAYEDWEAKLILRNPWNGRNGLPLLTFEEYDRLIEIQTMRNDALAAYRSAPRAPEGADNAALSDDRDKWRAAHDAQRDHYHSAIEQATARIGRLEAALREIEKWSGNGDVREIARTALGD